VLGEIIASALQRKHDAAALRDRDQLLRATLERAPAGVALTDPSGVPVQANPAFCRMLGYAESELTGKRVSELTRAEDWHLTEQNLTRALAEVCQLKERLEAENLLLREEIQLHQSHDELTGDGAAMRALKSRLERVAPSDATVLILGETGSGKELVANALHRLSARRERPLIKVNCAALPETLIEAELFGREKGAYTGALTRQIGRFEVADGATLLLDEIGELPLALQSKLLRVLQDGAFERLGSTRTLEVDVRLIAATNRDLERAVAEGRFREDLYYRLNVFPIRVPPLRERPEDIPALV
jgi:formate hydrogenlyase transcriptional activator